MRRIVFVSCLIAASTWSITCLAHGVSHSVIAGGVGLEVRYDDNSPMCYCEVKVFSPVDSETEFQEGFTDKSGRFTFFPDTAGTWRVVVDDGMGHGVTEDMEIAEGLKPIKDKSRGFTRFQGVVVGLSVIFGIFGTSTLFLPWKRVRR